MRVVTYSRVSTSHHDQNPEIQVHELRKFCKAREWTIVEEIKDFGSGGSDKREGLQRLFKLIQEGQVDCVAVTKLDRLFRSLRQLVTTLDEFQSKGIAFVAFKDAIDYTTPSGRLFTQILGSLAEFEKTLIRERTIAGLHYAKWSEPKTTLARLILCGTYYFCLWFMIADLILQIEAFCLGLLAVVFKPRRSFI